VFEHTKLQAQLSIQENTPLKRALSNEPADKEEVRIQKSFYK